MATRKRARSRKPAPGKAEIDLALSIAKHAVPAQLHPHARILAPAHAHHPGDKSAPHPLTEAVLARHAATLREPSPGDADVLFHDPSSGQPQGMLVQVRKGRVARVLVRAG